MCNAAEPLVPDLTCSFILKLLVLCVCLLIKAAFLKWHIHNLDKVLAGITVSNYTKKNHNKLRFNRAV